MLISLFSGVSIIAGYTKSNFICTGISVKDGLCANQSL